MHLNERQREKAFPIHVELGKKMPDMDMPMPSEMKKKKEKKFYPTLYISDVEGLQHLPEEGCILIDYKRRSMTINKRDDKEPTCSVELEIHTLCMPEEYEDTKDAEDIVDDLVNRAYKTTDDNEEETDEDDSDNE